MKELYALLFDLILCRFLYIFGVTKKNIVCADHSETLPKNKLSIYPTQNK